MLLTRNEIYFSLKGVWSGFDGLMISVGVRNGIYGKLDCCVQLEKV